MAGVSCKAGTEAIVGLSNPSYSREGFLILFPGAAASGPSPSNPAFPSPGSLWGVTFCSILTSGNRRSAASSPGGLGAAHRRAQHNPGSGGEAALPGPPDGSLAAVSCAALRTTPAAWRAPQAAAAGKWRRPLPAGEQSANPDSLRSSAPPSIPPDVGLPGPRLPAAAAGGNENRVRSPMEADEHRQGLQRAASSIFEILPRAEWRGGQTPRAGRGPRKGSCGGFYRVCTARRGRPRAGAEAICRRMDADWLGGPRSSGRQAGSSSPS